MSFFMVILQLFKLNSQMIRNTNMNWENSLSASKLSPIPIICAVTCLIRSIVRQMRDIWILVWKYIFLRSLEYRAMILKHIWVSINFLVNKISLWNHIPIKRSRCQLPLFTNHICKQSYPLSQITCLAANKLAVINLLL